MNGEVGQDGEHARREGEQRELERQQGLTQPEVNRVNTQKVYLNDIDGKHWPTSMFITYYHGGHFVYNRIFTSDYS